MLPGSHELLSEDGSLQLTRSLAANRYQWLHDSSPGTDYSGRDSVSMARETTTGTKERSLIGTVGLVDRPARGTSAAGVARIHQNHGYPSQPSLVIYERTELIETPVSKSCSLTAAGRNPITNTTQVFEGDTARGAFSRLHDGFGDAVVRVFLKPGLLTSDPLELACRGTSVLALEIAPAVGVDAAVEFDLSARIDVAIGVSGDVYDAKVHSQEVGNLACRWFLDFADHVEVEAPAVVDQVNLALAVWEKAPLIVAADERHDLTPAQRPEGHGIGRLETDNAVIVGDGPGWAEGSLCLAVEFVGIGDFGDAADDHLSRQLKPSFQVEVDKFLECKLVERPSIPGDSARVVSGGVGSFQRPQKEGGLVYRRLELEVDRQLHTPIIAHSSVERKGGPPSGGRAFLHGLKPVEESAQTFCDPLDGSSAPALARGPI